MSQAYVQEVHGGGPVFLVIGIVVLIVGVVVIFQAASFQKRMGLSPNQTAAPGFIQRNVNRLIGAAFCVLGGFFIVMSILAQK